MNDLPAKQHTPNASDETNEPPEQSHLNSSSATNRGSQRQPRKSNRCRKLRKAPIWIEAACAIALVVITGFYTHYAHETLIELIKQYPEITKSADAAKNAADTASSALDFNQREFRQEQRPYIWLSAGMATTDTAMAMLPLPELQKRNLPLMVNVQVFNGGKSPGIRIGSTRTIVIFDVTEIADQKLRNYVPDYLHGETIIPPNGSAILPSPDEAIPITDRLLSDLRNKKRVIYVVARVKYFDMFSPSLSVPYETAFCSQVSPDGLPFANCDKTGTSWIK